MAGHPHCQLPRSQVPEVEAFVEKFLLGNENADTDIATSPYNTDLSPWITWETPELAESSTAVDDPDEVLGRIDLSQNYPNPFSATTTITYTVPQTAHVEFKIYNALGQLIQTLSDEAKPAGAYSATWEGRNDAGEEVPPGIYFYRVKIGNAESTRRMIYVR